MTINTSLKTLKPLAVMTVAAALLFPTTAFSMDESKQSHKKQMQNKDMHQMADEKKSSITKNKDKDSTRGISDSGGVPLKMKESEDYRQRNEMLEKDRRSENFQRP